MNLLRSPGSPALDRVYGHADLGYLLTHYGSAPEPFLWRARPLEPVPPRVTVGLAAVTASQADIPTLP